MRSGMIGFLGAQSVATGDPYWDNVVALLHFDGDLVDETGRVWTPSGDLQFPDSPAPFGKSLSKAAGTYARMNSPSVVFGTGDFTVEFLLHVPPGSGSAGSYAWLVTQDITSGARDWQVLLEPRTQTLWAGSALHPDISVSYVASVGWHHVAWVRSSDVFMLFVDGVLVGSAVGAVSLSGNTPLTIGPTANQSITLREFTMDELRITKGVARYTENFTPPTEPFPNN